MARCLQRIGPSITLQSAMSQRFQDTYTLSETAARQQIPQQITYDQCADTVSQQCILLPQGDMLRKAEALREGVQPGNL